MKFACDSCQAQYMINDEKVGPSGVIVRCKKCQNKIVVKRPAPADEDRAEETVIMSNPMETDASGPPTAEVPAASVESALDDDIGRAFDSVLTEPSASSGELTAPGLGPEAAVASDFPFSSSDDGGSEDEDIDRQSTRVVNLAEMASLMKPEAKPAEPAKKADDGQAADEAKPESIEWFVAIHDQQVGPLDFEGVRKHWELGELSADSLVWHAGMSDWKPLSSVPDLGGKLAPRPEKTVPVEAAAAPAGASANGSETPATPVPSALPPPQAEPAEPAWKPSAASALESLVKDELDALEKAPSKAEPAGVGEPAPAPRGGLFDELPDVPEQRAPAAAAAAFEPPAARLPESTPSRGYEPDPEHEPLPERPARTAARPARHAPAEPLPAPAYAQPAPAKSKAGVFVGIGIFGGLLGVGAILALVLVFFKQPTAVLPPAPQPVAQQPVAQPPVAQQPPAVVPAAPVAPVEPAQAAEPAKAPAVAQAPQTPPEAQPAAAVAPPATEPKKVEEPAAVRENPKTAKRQQRERSDDRVAARTQQKGQQLDEEETITPEPPPPPPPPPAPKSGGGVDDDFERLFGGGGGEEAPAQAAQKPAKSGKTVYVPPAPGAGSTKETLGQSDVMEVVVANKGAIKRCTDEQKARDPESSGTVVMRWTITKAGKTSGIQSMTPEYRKSELSACLTGVIKSFKFPAYSGAQMPPIDFPFKF